ncbi:hypothetical protein GH5_08532 [Leishmania sp. Ghana 2012 LV757]|uniref:hypothetical protein n=1 Tax=Leishmania sp. Ghana 2012 LV757 TaxID=2803181 RepID=UPI001B72EC3C|nr:hypothetical protein GH5_08532 [Leishmania sp. Ghana 2012 LV757]
MSSSSSSATLSGFQGDCEADCKVLSHVRQSLADRRRSRVGVAPGGAAAAAAASAKSRKVTSRRSSLSVDNGAHSHGDHHSRCGDGTSDDRLRGQSPEALKQRRGQGPPSAPGAFLSHVADGALLSVSSAPSSLARATSTSASPTPSKPPTAKVGGFHPPRRISYYGGFLPHTLDAHDLVAAVFPKSSTTDSPLLPRSTSHVEDEKSAAAKHQRSPQRSLTVGHRERNAATARSTAGFDETLAEAMVSTAEHMLETQKWRDSAAQQQPLSHSSPSIPMIGGVIAIGNSGAAAPALTAAPGDSPTRGLPETPMTRRAMAALGHTAADAFAVADDDDSKSVVSVGFQRAAATGSSRHPRASSPLLLCVSPHRSHGAGGTSVYAGDFRDAATTAFTRPTPAPLQVTKSLDNAHGVDTRSRQSSVSSAAPSALWDINGRPVSRDGAREVFAVAHCHGENAMVTVSRGAAVPEAAEKSVGPQLSYHQLTEAFYGCYKGGEMAQDAYRYFVAQQQQHKRSCGVSGGVGSSAPRRQSSGLGAKLREGDQHPQSGSSAAKRRASMTMTMPTRASARARAGNTAQQVLEASGQTREPAVTSAASLEAAAAFPGAPRRLEPLSITTEVPLPVLRGVSDPATAEALQRRHVQPKTRLSITSAPGSARTNSSGSHCDARSASPSLSPPKLSAAVGSAAGAANDRIQALLRQSVSIYEEAQQRRQESRPCMDRPDA